MPSPASPEDFACLNLHVEVLSIPFLGREGSDPWKESIGRYCRKHSTAVECSLGLARFCLAMIDHGHFLIHPHPATFWSLFFKNETKCSISRELKPLESSILEVHCPSPSRALRCPEMCSYSAGKLVHKNYEELLLSPLLLSSEPIPQISHKIVIF